MKLSILQHSKDTCPESITIGQVVERIQSDNWPTGYQPVLMIQGVFEGGTRQEDITSLSGLSMAVFSHVDMSRLTELREEARDDPHTLLMYTAAESLIIIYPYELDTGFEIRLQRQFYNKAFLYGNDYYEHLLDAPSFRKGADAGKRCQLAHDAEYYYNPMADPFLVWEIKEGCRRQTSRPKSTEGLRERKPNYLEKRMDIDEIEDWLYHHIELRHNVITRRTEYRWLENNAVSGTGPWLNYEDGTLNSLYRRMKKIKDVKRDEIDWLIASDYVKDFNPFADYFEHLPPYDGNDYIMGMATSVRIEGELEEWFFFVECLRKWLVAMVAGWFEPDKVNHEVLVFIGRQGIYKTTWMNHILPPQLRSYFCTQNGIGSSDKEVQLSMTQYGLISCEELDSMTNREMNAMKRAITLEYVDARPAYGRHIEHRSHIASFCGTGNNEKFLNDPTGTRRWLAFKVEHLDSPRTYPFDYENIYAQAYYLYRNGFQYWLTENDTEMVSERNNRFRVANLEQQLVYRFYRQPTGTDTGEFVDVGTAMQLISGNIATKLRKEAVDQAFINLGFKSVVVDGMSGYLAVRRLPEEINALGRQMANRLKSDEDSAEPF